MVIDVQGNLSCLFRNFFYHFQGLSGSVVGASLQIYQLPVTQKHFVFLLKFKLTLYSSSDFPNLSVSPKFSGNPSIQIHNFVLLRLGGFFLGDLFIAHLDSFLGSIILYLLFNSSIVMLFFSSFEPNH